MNRYLVYVLIGCSLFETHHSLSSGGSARATHSAAAVDKDDADSGLAIFRQIMHVFESEGHLQKKNDKELKLWKEQDRKFSLDDGYFLYSHALLQTLKAESKKFAEVATQTQARMRALEARLAKIEAQISRKIGFQDMSYVEQPQQQNGVSTAEFAHAQRILLYSRYEEICKNVADHAARLSKVEEEQREGKAVRDSLAKLVAELQQNAQQAVGPSLVSVASASTAAESNSQISAAAAAATPAIK